MWSKRFWTTKPQEILRSSTSDFIVHYDWLIQVNACNKKKVLVIRHDIWTKLTCTLKACFKIEYRNKHLTKVIRLFNIASRVVLIVQLEHYIISQYIISWLSSISSDSSNICNHSEECTIKGWVIHIFNSELGKRLPKSPRELWTSPFFLFLLISSYYSHPYLILADLSALNVRQKFFGSVGLEVFLFWLALVVLRPSHSETQAGGKLTL